MSLLKNILLWGSTNAWLSERLPRTWFMKRAVRKFMPGETVDAALTASSEMKGAGRGTILTLLGENVASHEEAQAVTDHYLAAIGRICELGLEAVVSVKPTQVGLDLGLNTAWKNLETLASRAQDLQTFLWVDMEGSEYLDPTIELYGRLLRNYPDVGLALQAYLYRSADDLESLIPLGPRIRLVKGAYAEQAEIAWPVKKDVDENYLSLARRMLLPDALSTGTRPAFGTHDPEMISQILEEIEKRDIPASSYEFQMLYGIGRAVQERLVSEGRPLNVLISYGDGWFPWYMRRLAERPANVWFVIRSLFLA